MKHKTGTRKEWLAARIELLKAEKELTRRSDELARRRQELPWVRVDKEYQFETDEGKSSIADLFRGRSQLLVYHFMSGLAILYAVLAASWLALSWRDPRSGLFLVLGDRRRLQRDCCPSRQSRCDVLDDLARAASETAGVQKADGLDVSMGLLLRR